VDVCPDVRPDDHLYAVLTTDSWNAGAAADPEGWRGALLRIRPDGKTAERFANGLRSVSAMAFDATGELFFIDNQGGGNRTE
jgi:glucose/arabinose dehydrogenase